MVAFLFRKRAAVRQGICISLNNAVYICARRTDDNDSGVKPRRKRNDDKGHYELYGVKLAGYEQNERPGVLGSRAVFV